jgi:hypothetical protein
VRAIVCRLLRVCARARATALAQSFDWNGLESETRRTWGAGQTGTHRLQCGLRVCPLETKQKLSSSV